MKALIKKKSEKLKNYFNKIRQLDTLINIVVDILFFIIGVGSGVVVTTLIHNYYYTYF